MRKLYFNKCKLHNISINDDGTFSLGFDVEDFEMYPYDIEAQARVELECKSYLAEAIAECERLREEVKYKHLLNLNAMMKIQELETKLKEAE